PFLSLFTSPPPTHISPLSLHYALPISRYAILGPQLCKDLLCWPSLASLALLQGLIDGGFRLPELLFVQLNFLVVQVEIEGLINKDRNSTRLNSSHLGISYAVFCLKTKT